MKIASIIIFSIIFLGYSPSSAHAYLGQSISDFKNQIKGGIYLQDFASREHGVNIRKMLWSGNPSQHFRKNTRLTKLGNDLWETSISAFWESEENKYVIYEVSFIKRNPKPGQPNTITDDQRKIIHHDNKASDVFIEYTNLNDKNAEKHNSAKITLSSKILLAKLAEKKREFKKFKTTYLCIGQSIRQLNDRLGNGQPINDLDPRPTKWRFKNLEKPDWTIEITLMEDIEDNEPVAHYVLYHTKGKFTQKEMDWFRYINTNEKKWATKENGALDIRGDKFHNKYRTEDETIFASINKLDEETLLNDEVKIYTKAYSTQMNDN
jgi:hypothetical protein